MARRYFPFIVSTLVALINLSVLVRLALARTGGVFSYALDDPYVHLALARHIAFDGVYGVTKHAFSTVSSSIAWPFLLAAAMRVVGNHVTIPLVINVMAIVGLTAVISFGIRRDAPDLGVLATTLVATAIVLLIPAATLAMTGMEHVLHTVITIAFVLEAALVVADERRRVWPLLALGTMLVSIRYEGIFPIAVTFALLGARRRFKIAVQLIIVGAAPIVFFGIYSMAHGSLFFPNSVLLKRRHYDFHELAGFGELFGGNLLDSLSRDSYLLPITFGTIALIVYEMRHRGLWNAAAIRLIIAASTTLMHVELANLGWFFRYEAYLIAMTGTILAITIAPLARDIFGDGRGQRLRRLAAVLALGVGMAPLVVRAFKAQASAPLACRNIFEQQVQSARLLGRYFPHDPVVVNDIGAVAYYGEQPLVDLVGLASLDVATLRLRQMETPLGPHQIESFTRSAPVAIIYEGWFPNVPTSWVRLGQLRIDDNKVCAFNAVTVYATSGASVPRVLAALRGFAASLPEAVHREGRWIETAPDRQKGWRVDTGDVLLVDVPAASDSPWAVEVASDGSIHVPKIGELRARGLTLDALQIQTQTRSPPSFENGSPVHEVTVRLLEGRRCRIQISGHVVRPIDQLLDCSITTDKVLAMAGVRAGEALKSYVWREHGEVLTRIDLSADALGNAAAPEFILRGNDIVVVSE